MNGRRIQYPLVNVFVLTVVAAVVSWLVTIGLRRHDLVLVIVPLALGVPTAIGAPLAGVKGGRESFFWAMVASIVIVFGLLFVVAVVMLIGAIRRG